MVKVVKVSHHHWHNRHSEHPVLAASLDASALGGWRPTDLNSQIWQVLQERFSDLAEGGASTSVGELVVRIAFSLQRQYDCIPDIWGYAKGVTEEAGELFFAARDQFLAPVALQMAASFIRGLPSERAKDPRAVRAKINEVDAKLQSVVLDQSSLAMMAKLIERDIPVRRIMRSSPELQSGQGYKLRRSLETVTTLVSGLGARHASNKFMSLQLLDEVALPVGKFAIARDPQSAVQASERVGYPLVLKPIAGSQGKGVAVHLTSPDEVRAHAVQINGPILVQSFIPGDDHRLLVVKGKFIAGAKRIPGSVTGDGKSTIEELIEEINQDPERGHGYERLKVRIEVDAEAKKLLEEQSLTLTDVPASGQVVRLRATANISTGGTALDVTSTIHRDNVRMAERAALTLGLNVAGVDFLCPDITRSWHEVSGGICEINTAVGLRPHWLANPDQDVVGPIIETIFPEGDNGRIPTAMVTGTNGKTTTCNMLDVILREAGHNVGKATTIGVEVDGERLATVDWAGALGARVVLAEPTVTAAVLETARGGLQKWGTYLDWCDVAALLNVDIEHVGLDGINTVEEMAALKRKVIDCAQKAVVLNAECPYASAFINDYPAERTIAFALDADNEAALSNVARGGRAIVHREAADGGCIVLVEPKSEQEICKVADMPAALGGLARYNIANAMAAAGLAIGLEIPLETVGAGLHKFETSVELSPGRLNFIEGYPFDVLFDWATNPHAFAASIPVASALPTKGQKICAFSAIGNRPDEDYRKMAKIAAGRFDIYIPYERHDYIRGRAPGEINGLLMDGLIEENVRPDAVCLADNFRQAMLILAENVKPDDLLVILGSNIDEALPVFSELFGPPFAGDPVENNPNSAKAKARN